MVALVFQGRQRQPGQLRGGDVAPQKNQAQLRIPEMERPRSHGRAPGSDHSKAETGHGSSEHAKMQRGPRE